MGNESIEEIPRHRKCRYYVPGGFTEPGKNYCAPNAKTLGEQWEQRQEINVEDCDKCGHYFIGDFNYYIMPEEVYAAVSLEIPYAVGVYCPDGAELRSVKKAKRKDRERPVSEMLLMMFRSAARERRRGD